MQVNLQIPASTKILSAFTYQYLQIKQSTCSSHPDFSNSTLFPTSIKLFSFPFEIEWSPLFEFMFIASMWSGYVTITGIFGGDGLFFGLCVHISAEFDIIGSRISSLIEEEIGKFWKLLNLLSHNDFFSRLATHESIESFSPADNDRLYEKLKKIVIEHENLIDLCRKLSRSLTTNVLLHYLSSALITCICCLMILLAEGAQKVIFINYIIASTTQVFVYSMGGNLLADSSAKIQEYAYNFHWYKCDRKIRKLIHLMILRAQKKTGVDVPFFQTSLETFGSVSVSFCECC